MNHCQINFIGGPICGGTLHASTLTDRYYHATHQGRAIYKFARVHHKSGVRVVEMVFIGYLPKTPVTA